MGWNQRRRNFTLKQAAHGWAAGHFFMFVCRWRLSAPQCAGGFFRAPLLHSWGCGGFRHGGQSQIHAAGQILCVAGICPRTPERWELPLANNVSGVEAGGLSMFIELMGRWADFGKFANVLFATLSVSAIQSFLVRKSVNIAKEMISLSSDSSNNSTA